MSKILIVDDDENVRDVLRLMFQFEVGFDVVGEAGDGITAIAMALRSSPEIVVLDYAMPAQDGAKTAEVLRRIVPSVRIVAFSAMLQRKPEWADAFLTKNQLMELSPLIHLLAA